MTALRSLPSQLAATVLPEVDACKPPIDTTAFLCDSPFTVDWLLKSLQESDDNLTSLLFISKIQNIVATNITGDKGFVSKVYKISIFFENMTVTYDVILKVPGTETLEKVAAKVESNEAINERSIATAHNRECSFYNDFAAHIEMPLVKTLKALESQDSTNPGCLLMESLVGKADIRSIFTSASKKQAFLVAKHFAPLYKYFLCLPPDQWIGKFASNGLGDFVASDFYTAHFYKLAVMAPGRFDEGIKTFQKFIHSRKFYMYTMTDVYKEYALPPVLSHGDLWGNNLLWKQNADGSMTEDLAAIIDWQMMHEGCITNDIARFMMLCLDGDVRRECEYDVVRYLYEQITELMESDGKSVDFTYDQMEKAYNVNRFSYGVQMLMIGPLFFYGKECKPEEADIVEAQKERFFLRVEHAMEDALEALKNIPECCLIE